MAAQLVPIHLLYVPTLHCNLGCRYCYLGHETDLQMGEYSTDNILQTLDQAVKRFRESGYFPFNISLHGGEVTTLAPATLEKLFSYISKYYAENRAQLYEIGVKKTVPHIKTNLFNFHLLYDLFDKHRVSISASVDLPLFLHDKYRVTRSGGSTLVRILENIRLLASYPHGKKISTTLFRAHVHYKEQLVDDIEKLHGEYGFDMNRFNIMFGFESRKNRDKFAASSGDCVQMLSDDEQVELFDYLTERFMGTDLEPGLKESWFEEFTPDYCTNCFNCGEKFFLLQADGNLYSCVRGQGCEDFHYGNVLTTAVHELMQTAARKISFVHKTYGFAGDCRRCDYLHICHTGCPFVKSQTGSGKSYTCMLQKRLYEADPVRYKRAVDAKEQAANVREYVSDMHPNELLAMAADPVPEDMLQLPGDLYEQGNSLAELIDADPVLAILYSKDVFLLTIDGEHVPLHSQLFKPARDIYHLYPGQEVTLHMRRAVFEANCSELVRNTLYLQMLRDTQVVYGDERRTKQEHTFTHQVFFRMLQESSEMGDEYLCLPLSGLLELHSETYVSGVLNNLFVTTGSLREYHYKKQKVNRFYHIQALNLPFQNLEFFGINESWCSAGKTGRMFSGESHEYRQQITE